MTAIYRPDLDPYETGEWPEPECLDCTDDCARPDDCRDYARPPYARTCRTCNGRGIDPEHRPILTPYDDCPTCMGEGWV